MKAPEPVKTCLWFCNEAEEAARFYVGLIPRSRIHSVLRPEQDKPALAVEFSLGSTPFLAINGARSISFTDATSISVSTPTQAETDRLWTALTSNGGTEGRCGWLKDRFGVSWQVVPEALPGLLASSDRAASQRAMEVMLTMSRLDIAKIEAAYKGEG